MKDEATAKRKLKDEVNRAGRGGAGSSQLREWPSGLVAQVTRFVDLYKVKSRVQGPKSRVGGRRGAGRVPKSCQGLER